VLNRRRARNTLLHMAQHDLKISRVVSVPQAGDHAGDKRSGNDSKQEIVLPAKSKNMDWARDPTQLWKAEKEARRYEFPLPSEMTDQERSNFTRDFAQALANRQGNAVGFEIQKLQPTQGRTDYRAQLLATSHKVTPQGLGDKIDFPHGERKALEDLLDAHLGNALQEAVRRRELAIRDMRNQVSQFRDNNQRGREQAAVQRPRRSNDHGL